MIFLSGPTRHTLMNTKGKPSSVTTVYPSRVPNTMCRAQIKPMLDGQPVQVGLQRPPPSAPPTFGALPGMDIDEAAVDAMFGTATPPGQPRSSVPSRPRPRPRPPLKRRATPRDTDDDTPEDPMLSADSLLDSLTHAKAARFAVEVKALQHTATSLADLPSLT
jgi:hypothetical protein